jgi:protein-S-isoprenylcysteine O-methyltransferase Ste14
VNTKWRQRLVSLISSVVFLGFLWVLFKKMIIVTWISMPWWGLILLLIALFFFIETMVSRTLGAKEPAQRAQETVMSGLKQASDSATSAGQDSLEAVKARLEKFNQPKD